MDLLNMTQKQLLPVLSLGPSAAPGCTGGVTPATATSGKPAPLKTSSLSRLEELQAYLRQCDDQNYLKYYIKVLSSMPRDLLEELTVKLKARSAWLSGEEQREYKRAKLLNVMGPHSAAIPPGSGSSMDAVGVWCADADAFCSEVLAGGGESGTLGLAAAAAAAARSGHSSGMFEAAVPGRSSLHLERLEMGLEKQQHFVTPADALKTRTCMVPPAEQACNGYSTALAAGAAAGGTQAAGLLNVHAMQTDDGTLPPAPAGVSDHQIEDISPDRQLAAAATAPNPAQQQTKASGAFRARQTMLHDKTVQ